MSNTTTVDCPHCSVRVKADIKSWVGNAQEEAYFLVECPTCRRALFGKAFVYQDDDYNWQWDHAERLWPAPTNAEVSAAIPEAARRDIKDAQKCLSHGIYSAAAVLCGRALERLIKEKVGAHMIAKGLAELKARGIIDNGSLLGLKPYGKNATLAHMLPKKTQPKKMLKTSLTSLLRSSTTSIR